MVQFIDHFNQYAGKYNDCLEENKLVSSIAFEIFIEALKSRVVEQFSPVKNYSAWDLYNSGNEISRPDDKLSLRELLPISHFWGAYVFSRLA